MVACRSPMVTFLYNARYLHLAFLATESQNAQWVKPENWLSPFFVIGETTSVKMFFYKSVFFSPFGQTDCAYLVEMRTFS